MGVEIGGPRPSDVGGPEKPLEPDSPTSPASVPGSNEGPEDSFGNTPNVHPSSLVPTKPAETNAAILELTRLQSEKTKKDAQLLDLKKNATKWKGALEKYQATGFLSRVKKLLMRQSPEKELGLTKEEVTEWDKWVKEQPENKKASTGNPKGHTEYLRMKSEEATKKVATGHVKNEELGKEIEVQTKVVKWHTIAEQNSLGDELGPLGKDGKTAAIQERLSRINGKTTAINDILIEIDKNNAFDKGEPRGSVVKIKDTLEYAKKNLELTQELLRDEAGIVLKLVPYADDFKGAYTAYKEYMTEKPDFGDTYGIERDRINGIVETKNKEYKEIQERRSAVKLKMDSELFKLNNRPKFSTVVNDSEVQELAGKFRDEMTGFMTRNGPVIDTEIEASVSEFWSKINEEIPKAKNRADSEDARICALKFNKELSDSDLNEINQKIATGSDAFLESLGSYLAQNLEENHSASALLNRLGIKGTLIGGNWIETNMAQQDQSNAMSNLSFRVSQRQAKVLAAFSRERLERMKGPLTAPNLVQLGADSKDIQNATTKDAQTQRRMKDMQEEVRTDLDGFNKIISAPESPVTEQMISLDDQIKAFLGPIGTQTDQIRTQATSFTTDLNILRINTISTDPSKIDTKEDLRRKMKSVLDVMASNFRNDLGETEATRKLTEDLHSEARRIKQPLDTALRELAKKEDILKEKETATQVRLAKIEVQKKEGAATAFARKKYKLAMGAASSKALISAGKMQERTSPQEKELLSVPLVIEGSEENVGQIFRPEETLPTAPPISEELKTELNAKTDDQLRTAIDELRSKLSKIIDTNYDKVVPSDAAATRIQPRSKMSTDPEALKLVDDYAKDMTRLEAMQEELGKRVSENKGARKPRRIRV